MAEDISNIEKRESDRNPKIKEKHSTEVENIIDKCVMKGIRPLLIVLPVIGINIKEGRSVKCDIFRMLYLFVLLVIAMWLIVWQSYQMLHHGFAEEGSWYVSFAYQYVVVAVVYVAALKNQKIGHLLKDTLLLYTETADVDGANRRLKRRLWPLWVISTIILIALGCTFIVILRVLSINYLSSIDLFLEDFFGIKSDNIIFIHAVVLGTLTAFYFYLCFLNIFGCFAILQCFLIRECFCGLHIKLMANGDRYLQDYLIGHRKISGIVDRFNQTFNPAILTLVCILMINLVSLTADLTRSIKVTQSLTLFSGYVLLNLAQAVIVFTTFVYLGNEIRCEARRGIEILQELSISNTNSTNEETHNKNGQIALFIAHLNTSPVAISASGFFDVNANLITIIISIAISYFTLVFSTSHESKKDMKDALSMLSSLSKDLSSLSNNLSAPLNCSKD